MIDLILAAFVVGVFCGGFYCGKTFNTFSAMKDRIISAIK